MSQLWCAIIRSFDNHLPCKSWLCSWCGACMIKVALNMGGKGALISMASQDIRGGHWALDRLKSTPCIVKPFESDCPENLALSQFIWLGDKSFFCFLAKESKNHVCVISLKTLKSPPPSFCFFAQPTVNTSHSEQWACDWWGGGGWLRNSDLKRMCAVFYRSQSRIDQFISKKSEASVLFSIYYSSCSCFSLKIRCWCLPDFDDACIVIPTKHAIISECDGNLFWNLSSMPPTWLIKLYTAPP